MNFLKIREYNWTMYEDISSVVFDKFFLTRLLGGGGVVAELWKKSINVSLPFFLLYKKKTPLLFSHWDNILYFSGSRAEQDVSNWRLLLWCQSKESLSRHYWLIETWKITLKSVLRIRDVSLGSRIPDPSFSIPDPGSKRFRSRIHIKEFKHS
jgi:hypothetical protein